MNFPCGNWYRSVHVIMNPFFEFVKGDSLDKFLTEREAIKRQIYFGERFCYANKSRLTKYSSSYKNVLLFYTAEVQNFKCREDSMQICLKQFPTKSCKDGGTFCLL